jgi:fatty acid desaturase
MNGSINIISRRETLQHNTIDDCWLIIQNHVYDFTSFIKNHPGGSRILLSRAGEDATSYFIGKHGKNAALGKQLERLKIGTLPVNEQLQISDLEEPFFMELIDRSYSEKLYHIAKSTKNKFFWIRTANLSFFITFSILALYGNTPWWIVIALVFAQAVIGTSLFGLVAHESTHRNYPRNKLLRFALDMAWPIFWPFISQNALRYEHNSHHVKIGDPEYDYEVAAFASFIRYSGNVMPNSLHRYQHKLAKYIYPFYANIITTIGGFKSTFWSAHNRKVVAEHTLSILMTMFYYVILPTLVTGNNVLWYLFLYLVYQCVLYYGIYVGAAINHFVPQVIREIPEEQKNKFGYYVCHNTTNFCTDNKFWNWYTGGFNVQIEHHLIPFIPVENLQKMIPIVKELCIKYNYPYHNYNKVVDLWNAHYDFLKIMSLADTESSFFEKSNKAGYQAR